MKYSIGDIREDELGEEEGALNHLAVSPWTCTGEGGGHRESLGIITHDFRQKVYTSTLYIPAFTLFLLSAYPQA